MKAAFLLDPSKRGEEGLPHSPFQLDRHLATLTLVLPARGESKNPYSSTRERKITQKQPSEVQEKQGRDTKMAEFLRSLSTYYSVMQKTRCTQCKEPVQHPAGTHSLHQNLCARPPALTNIRVTLLSYQHSNNGRFAVQSVKNKTLNVSKIHYKTIKGCMSLQCIVTSIKTVVTFIARGPHLHQLFECQKSNLWFLKKIPLSLPFIFLNEVNFVILEDAICGYFKVRLPHYIFRNILTPLFPRYWGKKTKPRHTKT